MKKHKTALLFYEHIENLIPYMDDDLQYKMEFASYFIDCLQINNLENSRISIDPMDEKTLQFLIFSILLEYDCVKELETVKRLEKDPYSLEVDKIFPIKDRTVEETQFIDHFLDQIHVDLESEDNQDIILSPKQLIFLLQGIIIEWDIFKEKAKKKNEK
jgi:hypothetical protein